MKTRKILASALAALMVLSMLAGCTSNPSNDNDSSVYNIGICQLVEHDALDAATKGFMDALKEELGEENVKFDLQNAQGDAPTCTTIVNQFVSDEVDLILANATPALQSAAAATNTIPVLGTSITEYGVALEIEDFDGTVGGNISGTSDLAPLDEQAKMLKEWFPEAKKVALLYCSAEANSKYQVDVMEKELENMGMEATQYSFSDSNDLSAICTTAANENDVIYVPTDNAVASNTGIIDNICRPMGKPVVAGEEGICKGCGVATLSISYYDLGVTTGKMAAKILRGESKIEEMAIEYAPAAKKYNKDICDALKIKVVEGYAPIETAE